MPDTHPNILGLLDLAVDEAPPGAQRHVARCAPCARRLDGAREIVAAGRRLAAAPVLERRHVNAAVRIFRRTRTTWLETSLRLVTDLLLAGPTPALRDGATAATTRFLRFEGRLTLELQIAHEPGARTFSLHGCALPATDAGGEALLVGDDGELRAPIDDLGGFSFRGVRAGAYELRIGSVATARVEL